MEKIYCIYVMSEPWHINDKGFPDCGRKECVGFYYDEEDAVRAVEENWGDIQDHYALAAEIIPTKPGIYPYTPKEECYYYLWDAEAQIFKKKPWSEVDLGDWVL